MGDYKFENNEERRRYELHLGDGSVAFVDYRVMPSGSIALTRTEVPYEYENQGIGTLLVGKCIEDIREKGRKVVPSCGFVAAYIRRNPEWLDLVDQEYD
jgi:predicted GNAT family acetyltransferase